MTTTPASRYWIDRSRGCFLALLILAGIRAASADDPFGQHYGRAEHLYKKGQYEEAIGEFKAAYAVKRVPALLINIGQAYLKLRRPQDALSYYDFYLLADPSPAPAVRARLDASRAQARSMLEAAQPPPPGGGPASSSPLQQAPAATASPVEAQGGIRFIAADPRQRFRVEVRSAQGSSACSQEITRFRACSMVPLPLGPVTLSIMGTSEYNKRRLTREVLLMEPGISEVSLADHGYWILATGLVSLGVGISLTVAGIATLYDPKVPASAGIPLTVVGGIGVLSGGGFLIADGILRRRQVRLTPPSELTAGRP